MIFDFISSLLGAPSSGWQGSTDQDHDAAMGDYMATLGSAFSQAARGGTLGQALTQGIQQGRQAYSGTMDRYEQRRQAEAQERRAESQETRLANADSRAGEMHDLEVAEVERMNGVFANIDSVLAHVPPERASDIKLAFQMRETKSAFDMLKEERNLNPALRQALRDEQIADWESQLNAGMVVSPDRVQDENERHNKVSEGIQAQNAATSRQSVELASRDRAVGHMIDLMTGDKGKDAMTPTKLMEMVEDRRKAWQSNVFNQRPGTAMPDFEAEVMRDYEEARERLGQMSAGGGGGGGGPLGMASSHLPPETQQKVDELLNMSGLQGPEREKERQRIIAKGEGWINGAWNFTQNLGGTAPGN